MALEITRQVEDGGIILTCRNPETGFVFYVIGNSVIADECSVMKAKTRANVLEATQEKLHKKLKEKQSLHKRWRKMNPVLPLSGENG